MMKSINFEGELTNSGLKIGKIKLESLLEAVTCGELSCDNFSCVVYVDRESTLQVEDGYAGSECPQLEKMRRCVCVTVFCSVEVSWVVVETN